MDDRVFTIARNLEDKVKELLNLLEDSPAQTLDDEDSLAETRSLVSSENYGSIDAPDEVLRVELLDNDSMFPTRSSDGAAGYDVSAISAGVVPAGASCLVGTGIAVAVPKGTYGRLASRSGLAVKSGIHVGAGVIDMDYRGEIKVLLMNSSQKDFVYDKGSRIAQLIVEKISLPAIKVVGPGELGESARGSGGFGSTGL